jgi:C terminal SARAH domain of Mst1
MAAAKQAELNELIEDLELRQFILNDLQSSQPNDHTSIAEAQAEVDAYQAKISRLLGEDAPAPSQPAAPAPAPRVDSPAVSRQPDTIAPPTAASSSSRNVDAGPPASVRPAGPSLDPPRHTMAPAVRQDSRADPASTPYWPSYAPSPFAASSSQQSGYPLPIPGSRKRPRQDSGGALSQPQSLKRTVVNNSESRMKNIDTEMERELAKTRKLYEDLRQPDNLRFAAITEGISEDQLRRRLEDDEAESEREVRKEFRVKADAELARMLQAVDEPGEDEHVLDIPLISDPPTYNIPPGPRQIFTPRPEQPSRSGQLRPTFPQPPPNESRSTISLPDRTHLRLPPPGRSPYMTGNPLQQSSSPYVNPYGLIKREGEIKRAPLSMPGGFPNRTAGDDDLREISPAYFNSRFGGPPRFGPPLLPGRPLPWMQDPWGGDTDTTAMAMDLVREQIEQDMDDDDFVYVSVAPLSA